MTTETGLSPLEIALGLALGSGARVRLPPTDVGPREALDTVMRAALRRPPCLVSFSGGRDSSCVLAAAVELARREGHPLPVPATLRFPGAAGTDESEWQHRVVEHLHLDEWLRIELRDELDPVGPVARRVLERHGLLWPFNAHFHVPILEAARGGSVLTGIGGDEAFGESRWHRANVVLARAVRATVRDVLPVSLALAPAWARRAVLTRRIGAPFGWLTEDGCRQARRALGAQQADEPRRFASRLAWWQGLRSTRLGFESLRLLAADTDVALLNPIADPLFASSLARHAPPGGPLHRGRFMAEVFGDLLPGEIYARRTKAVFDTAFWGDPARAFVADWSGEGADSRVVDVDALRAEWLRPVPDPHTFTLLQAAWLERRNAAARRESPPRSPAATPRNAGAAAPRPAAPQA